MFFFGDFIEGVLLHNINTRIEGEKVSYGELLVFIGVWQMMDTIKGPSRRDFWSEKKYLLEVAPFRVSGYMTRNRFEAISYSFKYTNEEAPQYKDPFNEFRQIPHMWNKNMDH